MCTPPLGETSVTKRAPWRRSKAVRRSASVWTAFGPPREASRSRHSAAQHPSGPYTRTAAGALGSALVSGRASLVRYSRTPREVRTPSRTRGVPAIWGAKAVHAARASSRSAGERGPTSGLARNPDEPDGCSGESTTTRRAAAVCAAESAGSWAILGSKRKDTPKGVFIGALHLPACQHRV